MLLYVIIKMVKLIRKEAMRCPQERANKSHMEFISQFLYKYVTLQNIYIVFGLTNKILKINISTP